MQIREYARKTNAKNASALKVGVVMSRFNSDITEAMLKGALETLREWRVKKQNITILKVPGSFEIPYACARLIKTKKLDALVALGCIIKGETKHDEYIASAVSHGLINIMREYNKPIGFGVITTNNLAQAKVRSRGRTNKGVEAAMTALEMALL